MKNENKIQLNWSQIITALAIGAITGVVGILRLADTNTIVIAGNTQAIQKLENELVPRTEYEAFSNSVLNSLERIERKVDSL